MIWILRWENINCRGGGGNLGAKKAGVDYVLDRFSDEEKKVVRGVVDAVAKAIINI
jgi:peptidyl-tRNA hydrolase